MAEKIFRPDTPDPDSDPYGELSNTRAIGHGNSTQIQMRRYVLSSEHIDGDIGLSQIRERK